MALHAAELSADVHEASPAHRTRRTTCFFLVGLSIDFRTRALAIIGWNRLVFHGKYFGLAAIMTVGNGNRLPSHTHHDPSFSTTFSISLVPNAWEVVVVTSP
jgi:hypothetical protein